MNWDDYEEANRENFTSIRQEMVTSCKECGASIRGGDEKKLKAKRSRHAALHLRSQLYLKSLMDRVGAKEPADGKLCDHLDGLTEQLAARLYSEFQLHVRYLLDDNHIWNRLTVSQKGHLDFMLKHKWDIYTDTKDKEAFMRYAKEFVETVFPEIMPLEERNVQ